MASCTHWFQPSARLLRVPAAADRYCSSAAAISAPRTSRDAQFRPAVRARSSGPAAASKASRTCAA
eukprot:3983204-Lingulodinium_polyedra.AAC.1